MSDSAASVGPADGVRVSAGSDHRASGASNTPSAAFVGSRIPDGRWFDSPRQAGDYGAMEVKGQGWRWFNRPPNAEPGDPDCVLNENHVVVINLDGTITVHASIENRVWMSETIGGAGPISTRGDVRSWHGHLENGIWRSV